MTTICRMHAVQSANTSNKKTRDDQTGHLMHIVSYKHLHCAFFAAALVACPQFAVAESLPLWEVGIGAAAISFPDYRGSTRRHSYLLPVPAFVYRGNILQVDREKIRGLLYTGTRTQLDVSINGSVPVRSSGNTVRQGMPDLDPTLEIGPTLNLLLAENSQSKLSLKLPLRVVIASDFRSIHNAGLLANPNLNLDLVSDLGWRLGLVAGVLFGDQKYHGHFYAVSDQYARPGRPAYRASGGYSGAQGIVALSRRFESVWVAGFVKYDALNRAKFESSPLLGRRNNLSAGFAVTWTIAKSNTLVARRE